MTNVTAHDPAENQLLSERISAQAAAYEAGDGDTYIRLAVNSPIWYLDSVGARLVASRLPHDPDSGLAAFVATGEIWPGMWRYEVIGRWKDSGVDEDAVAFLAMYLLRHGPRSAVEGWDEDTRF